MGATKGTFDFDIELKKRSSLTTILDNSYTFNIIPNLAAAQTVYYFEHNSNFTLNFELFGLFVDYCRLSDYL